MNVSDYDWLKNILERKYGKENIFFQQHDYGRDLAFIVQNVNKRQAFFVEKHTILNFKDGHYEEVIDDDGKITEQWMPPKEGWKWGHYSLNEDLDKENTVEELLKDF